jgi:type IV secretion system protein VirB6
MVMIQKNGYLFFIKGQKKCKIMSLKFKNCLLIFLSCLLFSINIKADDSTKADDPNIPKTADTNQINSILDIFKNITCYTQNLGDLIFTEQNHTCTMESVMSPVLANILSPGLYANTLLKLKINDNNPNTYLKNVSFPDSKLSYQCKRVGRPEYDPRVINDKTIEDKRRITFGVCNEILIKVAFASQMVGITQAIIESIIDGTNLWDNIKKDVKTSSYVDIFKDKKIGDSGMTADILPVWYRIIDSKDKICVATPAVFGSEVPVGCVFVKEPFLNSIYGDFFGKEKLDNIDKENPEYYSYNNLVKCSDMGSCYVDAKKNSKTLIPISSPLIECIKRMITKLLVSESVCKLSDINTAQYSDSMLYKFQQGMRRTVSAFLTIYIIFFGFRLILQGNSIKKSDFILAVIKFILVVYFSIGLNDIKGPTGGQTFSGMIDWAFPIMFKGADSLTSLVMNAGTSGLCDFSNASYESGYQYISLWDSLDCRVTHYLGLNMIYDYIVDNIENFRNFNFSHIFTFSYPPYLLLLIPAVLTGNILLAQAALAYPLLIISVGAYMVNAFIVCMIAIAILGLLAPIFVPMALFNYTQNYFNAWLKLMISFVFQPIVVASFMVLMFSIYDSTFYDSCRFKSYSLNDDLSYTELSGSNKSIKNILFIIDDNSANYNDDPEALKKCKSSLGYILNNPIASIINGGKAIVSAVPDGSIFSGSVTKSPGVFFENSFGLLFDEMKNILLSIITCCLVLYLMYNFSAQLSEFAADVASSIPLRGMSIGPQDLFKKGMELISFAGSGKGLGNPGESGNDSIVGGQSRDELGQDFMSDKGSISDLGKSVDKSMPNKKDSNDQKRELGQDLISDKGPERKEDE